MSFRTLLLTLVLMVALSHTVPPAHAQGARVGSDVPLTVSMTLPAQRPDLSVGGVLGQAAMGVVGGFVGAIGVGAPAMLLAWGADDSAAAGIAMVAAAVGYVGGTTAGVHLAGRWQGRAANPWITTAGVFAGLALAGATTQEDEAGHAEPSLLFYIAPSAGGTIGYALTRRAR